MNNPQIRFFSLLITLIALPALLWGQSAALLDRVAAVVGKEVILLSDVKAQARSYAMSNKIDPSTPGLEQEVLDAMINERLIVTEALEDTNITVAEDEVTNEIDALVAQGIQSAGSQEKLEEVYGMPVAKLKREYRDEARKRLYAGKLQQLKFGAMGVTKREVEQFYETYKDSLPIAPEEVELYHILRTPSISAESRAGMNARVMAVLDSIRAGGDFADFATRYSQDPGSAVHGGDLGFVRRGIFVKEMEEALFSLKEQEIAGPVETVFGLHIIQLLERRGETVHARHILFKIDRDSTAVASTVQFLTGIKDSVAAGVPFEDLARRHSEDKNTAPLGGSIGTTTIDRLDESLQSAVRMLKEGEISDPIPVTQGTTTAYQLLYVKRRIPEHRLTIEQDYAKLEQIAANFKRNDAYLKWIEQLRKDIYWEVRI